MSHAGVPQAEYRYYNPLNNRLDIAGFLEDIRVCFTFFLFLFSFLISFIIFRELLEDQ